MISAALSPDGRTLAVANSDRTISLWAIATGKITDLSGSAGPVQSIAFSPDSQILASSGIQPQEPRQAHSAAHTDTSTVRLWELATGQATALASRPDNYHSRVLG